MLEDQKVRANIRDRDGSTALHQAVNREYRTIVWEIVWMLLKRDQFNKDEKDKAVWDGVERLACAALNRGQETVMRILLNDKTDISKEGRGTIHQMLLTAVNNRNMVAVRLLLEKIGTTVRKGDSEA